MLLAPVTPLSLEVTYRLSWTQLNIPDINAGSGMVI